MAIEELSTAKMDALVREYYDGCNEADREKIMRCFTPDASPLFSAGYV